MIARRRGFTLVELLVSISIAVILLSLLLSAIQSARESSRRLTCANHLRQLNLAVLNYESTYRILPGAGLRVYLEGPNGDSPPIAGIRAGRWSGWIAILPYIDQADLYFDIDQGYEGVTTTGSPVVFGPYGFRNGRTYVPPRDITYHPATRQLNILRCPSDPGRHNKNYSLGTLGRTNYAFCHGDNQRGIESTSVDQDHTRGAFSLARQYRIADVIDGLTNTLSLGEISTIPSLIFTPDQLYLRASNMRLQGYISMEIRYQADAIKGIDVDRCKAQVRGQRYQGSQNLSGQRGFGWLDAAICFTGFNAILPPNSAACMPPGSDGVEGGIYTSSSYHPDGVNVAFLDSSTRFITNTVNAISEELDDRERYSPGRMDIGGWKETANWTAPSPFGIWGAMSTRQAGDSVALD